MTAHAFPRCPKGAICDPVPSTHSEYELGDTLTVVLPWVPDSGAHWVLVDAKTFAGPGPGEGTCDVVEPSCMAEARFYLTAIHLGSEDLRFELRYSSDGRVIHVATVPVTITRRKQ
jgi:hypothetical protein